MKTVEKMNIYLANLNVFYRKLQNFHWYVKGTQFFETHAKLEELYDKTSEQIDEIGERILSINGRPLATLKDYIEVATIEEAKNEYVDTIYVYQTLIKDYTNLLSEVKDIKRTADEEEDFGTSATMDEYIIEYEKTLWMLKSVLMK